MPDAATGTTDTARRVPAATPLALVKQLRGAGFTVIDAARHEPLGSVGTGRQPHAVALHPSDRWAYAPYMGSNTLEVLDLQQLSVATRLTQDTIGTAPVGATMTLAGRYLLVSTYGDLPTTASPGIAVFETHPDGGLTLVDELPVGKAAGIVTDPRNEIWVALKDESAVVRLAGRPPFDRVSRYEVPGDPQDISFSRTYGLLAVNNVEDGSVSFIDVLADEYRATVPAPTPRGGTAIPRADRWVVGNMEGDGITAIDLDAVRSGTGGRLPDAATPVTLGTPTAFTDLRPDGGLLAVDAYEDDRVTFLDPTTLAEVARVRTGGVPHHPRFSADGRVCYVPNQEADTVSVLDTATVDPAQSTVPLVTEIPVPADAAPSGCFRTDRR